VIAPGARADLVVWDAERPAQIVYWLGAAPVHAIVKRGLLTPAGPASTARGAEQG
jgi:imidazolonepropionase-like amidohydrolase